MSVLEFIASLVSSIISIPMIVLILVIVFRPQIAKWFNEFPSHIKLGSSEIKWERDATMARAGLFGITPGSVSSKQDEGSRTPPGSQAQMKTGSEAAHEDIIKSLVRGHEDYGVAFALLELEPRTSMKIGYIHLRDHLRENLKLAKVAGGSRDDITDLALAARHAGIIDETVRTSIYKFALLYEEVEAKTIQTTPARATLFLELGSECRRAFDLGFREFRSREDRNSKGSSDGEN